MAVTDGLHFIGGAGGTGRMARGGRDKDTHRQTMRLRDLTNTKAGEVTIYGK